MNHGVGVADRDNEAASAMLDDVGRAAAVRADECATASGAFHQRVSESFISTCKEPDQGAGIQLAGYSQGRKANISRTARQTRRPWKSPKDVERKRWSAIGETVKSIEDQGWIFDVAAVVDRADAVAGVLGERRKIVGAIDAVVSDEYGIVASGLAHQRNQVGADDDSRHGQRPGAVHVALAPWLDAAAIVNLNSAMRRQIGDGKHAGDAHADNDVVCPNLVGGQGCECQSLAWKRTQPSVAAAESQGKIHPPNEVAEIRR